LLVIGALVAVWLLSRWLDVQVTEQLAAVALIPASVVTFLGWRIARPVLFPLLYLLAAVPLGAGIVPYLMVVTADIATALLRLMSVPVFRDGQLLALPGGAFEVADVCAGLNYLVSGVMISLLYAYLTFSSNVKRVLFVAGTACILIVANGVRAFIVMYVASATNMQYLGGRDHVWFGWVLFGAVVTVLFVMGARWADEPEQPVSPAGMAGTAAAGGARQSVWPLALVLALVMLAATAQTFQATIGSSWKFVFAAGAVLLWVLVRKLGGAPMAASGSDVAKHPSSTSTSGRGRAAAVMLTAACLLAVGPLLLSMASPGRVAATAFVDAPVPSGCERLGAPSTAWHAIAQRADFAAVASFSCAKRPVNAMVAGYWGTGPARETHQLLPGAWHNLPAHTQEGFEASGHGIRVNELRGNGRLAWYWYRVGTRPVQSALGVKLFEAIDLIRLREPSSSVYMLETPLDDEIDASRRRLAQAATPLWALNPTRVPAHGTFGQLTLRK
jgi:exosortase